MGRSKFVLFIVLFLGSLTISFFKISPAHAFSGSGAGTPLNPYQITTCAQLEEVNSNLAASYKVMNFIDCSAMVFTPLGSASTGGFTGTFDGDSNTISGVTINNPSGDHLGLFGFLEGGSVSNLTITNSSVQGGSYIGILAGGTNGFGSATHVAVISSSARGSAFIGGLVGSLFQFSISDSHTTDTTVTGANASGITSWIGGLTGEINMSDVARAYVSGSSDVTGNADNATQSQYVGGFTGDDGNGSNVSDSFTTANVTGHNYVGGVSGSANDTSYTSSYATGNVTGDNFVGGFTGRLLSGAIDHSFAAGSVTGFTSGGLVGDTSAASGGTISASAWDVTRSGQTNCVGNLEISITCSGVNVANAAPNYFFGNHTNAPLNSWDFSTIWRTKTADYPALQAPPVRPDNVRVNRTDTSLQVLWDQPPDDGGSPVTSYELQWGLLGGSMTDVSGLSPSTLTYTLNNLSPSTTYGVQIRAINARGAGEWLGFYTNTLATPSPGSGSSSSSSSSSAPTSVTPAVVESSLGTSTPTDQTTSAPVAESTPTSDQEQSQTQQSPSTNEQSSDQSNTAKGGFDWVWLWAIVPGGLLLVWLGVVVLGKLRA